jgi:hypothetical protein
MEEKFEDIKGESLAINRGRTDNTMAKQWNTRH